MIICDLSHAEEVADLIDQLIDLKLAKTPEDQIELMKDSIAFHLTQIPVGEVK